MSDCSLKRNNQHPTVPDFNDASWRDIPGFPGYKINDHAEVWSCWARVHVKGRRGLLSQLTEVWRPLKPYRNKSGRISVALTAGGKVRTILVYKLVMSAFMGPCPAGMVICHWNGNLGDNRLCNLRYDTHVANEEDKKRHGRRVCGTRVNTAKLDAEKVNRIRKLLKTTNLSLKAIAQQYGVDATIVGRIRDKKIWKDVVEDDTARDGSADSESARGHSETSRPTGG